MKQKRTIIWVAVFFTVCLIIYAFLGGLKEVKLSIARQEIYHMVGTSFSGKIESDHLKKLFLESKNLVEENKVEGTLAIMYFKDAVDNTDSIECFTGILLNSKPDNIPAGMEYKFFNSNGAVKARFDGHRLVTPNPAEIKGKVDQYAKEKSLVLQSIFVEKYFSNNAIEVDYLIN